MSKRFLLLLLVSVLSISSLNAQSKRYIYCEVSAEGHFFKGGCTLRVNYGQAKDVHSSSKKTRICDDEGKPLNFTNRIDALNWLSEKGWEYCSSTTEVSGSGINGNSSVSSSETWIMKYCVDGLSEEEIDAVYQQFNIREP